MTKPTTPRIDAPEGWESTEEESTVASLSLGGVGFDCVSRTVVYRRRVEGETLSFVFGSRVGFDPSPSATARAVLRVLGDRVWSGVEDNLRDRGLSSLERTGSRDVTIGDHRALLRRYSATTEVDGETTPVVAWIAVWADDSICVAGGAYPDPDSTETSHEDGRRVVMDAVHSFV